MKARFVLFAVAVVGVAAAFGEYQYIIDPGPERVGGQSVASVATALSASARGVSRSAADALSAKSRTVEASAGCGLDCTKVYGTCVIIR